MAVIKYSQLNLPFQTSQLWRPCDITEDPQQVLTQLTVLDSKLVELWLGVQFVARFMHMGRS